LQDFDTTDFLKYKRARIPTNMSCNKSYADGELLMEFLTAKQDPAVTVDDVMIYFRLWTKSFLFSCLHGS
jgi:hypothetical protein